MTVHTFTKATPGNFISASVNPNLLDAEIRNDGLTNLISIEVGDVATSNTDLVTTTFSVALTGTQVAELSGVIAVHAGASFDSQGFLLSGAIKDGFLFQEDGIPGNTPIQSQISGATSPTATDDSGKGFRIGSRWINVLTLVEFVLTDDTISGAIWKDTTTSGAIGTDHGTLTGLLDDDHPQYILSDGSRPMSGTFDLSGNDIIDVGNLFVSGNLSVTGTINGIRCYGVSATDPTTPPPTGGDKYYNSVLNEEMRYDGSRAKWLSVSLLTFLGGRNGNTADGSFYRATNNMAMNGVDRGYRISKGTITFASMTRSDVDDAVLEILVSGSVVAILSSSTFASADETLDGDFEAGVMAFRNKAGLNATANVQIVVTIKKRI